MNCRRITTSTSFKSGQLYHKFNSFDIHQLQQKALENNKSKIFQNLDNDQSFWDGILSIFGAKPRFSELRKYEMQNDKSSMERITQGIADTWQKVGNTLRKIIGGE